MLTLITAIDYVRQEYEKWYNAFLTHATGTAYEGVAADRVDEIIAAITPGRNSTFPFYYEDMVGWGENVSTRSYTVMGASQTDYALDSQHDITTLSNRAVYVYLNDVQLITRNRLHIQHNRRQCEHQQDIGRRRQDCDQGLHRHNRQLHATIANQTWNVSQVHT